MPTELDVALIRTKTGDRCTPNPCQRWILKHFPENTILDLYISGGLGSAKTTVGANVLVRGIVQNIKEVGIRDMRYAIISSDHTQLWRVTLATFRGIWNATTGHHGYGEDAFMSNPTVTRWNKQKSYFELFDAIEVHYGTGENAAKAIEGAEYSIIWVDEPALCKEETQQRLRERFRENVPGTVRGIISTGTPRPGWSLAWIHEHFGKGLTDRIPDRLGKCRIAIPTEENAHNLPPGYMERLEGIYSPQMLEAMLRGRFVILAGQVYGDWSTEAAVDYEHRADRPVIIGWDPGYRRAAYVCVQPSHAYRDGVPVIGEQGWTIFDELMTADTSTEEQARILADRPWMREHSFVTIAHDPAAVQKQSTAGTNDMTVLRDVLEERGINVVYRSSRRKEDHHITARVERLRAAIKAGDGTRRLTIARPLMGRQYAPGEDSKPCLGVHRCLLEQPFRGQTDLPDDGPNWKHASHGPDATGYLAVYLFPARRVDDTSWKEANVGAERPALGAELGDVGRPDELTWGSDSFNF